MWRRVGRAMRASVWASFEIRPFTTTRSRPNYRKPGAAVGPFVDESAGCASIIARVSRGDTVHDLAALRSRVMKVAHIRKSRRCTAAWIEWMRDDRGPVFAGIGILALVIIATIISVVIVATRGAMAANRPIVGRSLHLVGAGDRYIATRCFFGIFCGWLEGGGCSAAAFAMLAFGFSESIASWFRRHDGRGDQFADMLGTFRCARRAIWPLAAQAMLIEGITPGPSRRTLFASWTISSDSIRLENVLTGKRRIAKEPMAFAARHRC